jgi:hypothetical protein
VDENTRQKYQEQGRGFAKQIAGYVALGLPVYLFIYLMIVMGGIA